MTKREKRKIELREELAHYLRPGEPVYCILRHVSRSGMQRAISLLVIHDNQPYYLDHSVAELLGSRVSERWGGIVVNGCGMDMGFHLVYNLAVAVFCYNEKGEYEYDRNKAYSLKQCWM